MRSSNSFAPPLRDIEQELRYLYSESNLRRIEPELTVFDKTTANKITHKSLYLREVGKAAIPIKFCEAKKLHIEDVSNLRSFSSGKSVEWPSLETVMLNHCPKIKKFGLGLIKESHLKSTLIIDPHINLPYLFELLDDKFSLITEYNVCEHEELSKVINNLQSSHFTNLQIFRAKNYQGRLHIFLSILMRRSHKLEIINIEKCKLGFCHYLFDSFYPDEETIGDHKFFRLLKELKLIETDLILHIWKYDRPTVIDLGNLQILHVKGCRILQCIFYSYPLENLHHLRELIIEACGELHTIYEPPFDKVAPTTKFPSLNKLEFKFLPKLRKIYTGHLEFPSLQSVIIEKCPILEKFTTGFADPNEKLTIDGKSFFELNEIVFDRYDNLVCVISSETLQELRNLKKLVVTRCKELKIVFNIHQEISYSTQLLHQLYELLLIDLPKLTCITNKENCRLYPNLKTLQVKQCNSLSLLQVPQNLINMEISNSHMLEKIIIIEEKVEIRREKLIFHELKHVSLENLSKLSVAFPSIYEFPSLQTLKIANCSAMESLVEDSKALTESSTTKYFFPSSLLMGKLKELHIINTDVKKLWQYNYPFDSFCELEILRLTNNKKLLSAISFGVILKFKNLKKITLDKCEILKEVFDLEDDNLDHNNTCEILPRLEVLSLINLIKLKYVWNKEPEVSFFPNLVSLYIVHCHSLQSLFSISSIKNMGKLKILRLCKCDNIEEIISEDISGLENVPIIFPELECLVMKDLPILVSFYGKSQTLYCPKLNNMRVSNIPKMETFSRGTLVAPFLRSIYVTFVKKTLVRKLEQYHITYT